MARSLLDAVKAGEVSVEEARPRLKKLRDLIAPPEVAAPQRPPIPEDTSIFPSRDYGVPSPVQLSDKSAEEWSAIDAQRVENRLPSRTPAQLLKEAEMSAKTDSVAGNILVGGPASGLMHGSQDVIAGTVDFIRRGLLDTLKDKYDDLTGNYRTNAEKKRQRAAETPAGEVPVAKQLGEAGDILQPTQGSVEAMPKVAQFGYKATEGLARMTPALAASVLAPAGTPAYFALQARGAARAEAEKTNATQAEKDAYVNYQTVIGALFGFSGPASQLEKSGAETVLKKIAVGVPHGAAAGGAMDVLSQYAQQATIDPEKSYDLAQTFEVMGLTGLQSGVVGGVAKAMEPKPPEMMDAVPQWARGSKEAPTEAPAKPAEAQGMDFGPLYESMGLPKDPRNGTVPTGTEGQVVKAEEAPPEPQPVQETPVFTPNEQGEKVNTGAVEPSRIEQPSGTTPPETATEAAPTPHPVEAPVTEPAPTDGSQPTGIKNRIVDAELAAMGKQVEKSGGSTLEDFRAEAVKTLEADPTAGRRLVDSLSENMRAPTGAEDALLAAERNRLRLERAKIAKELEGGVTDELLQKAREVDAEYLKASQVSDTAGYHSSISLGTRRLELNEDYSLANLVYEYTVRNEIHPENVKGAMEDLKRTAAEYEAKKTALDKQEAALREREAKMAADAAMEESKVRVTRRQKQPSAATKWLTVKADEARARMKARLHQANMQVDPQAIADLAIIAAEHVSKGVDAATALVAEFGEAVRPHMEEILARAKGVPVERFKEAMKGKELNRLRPLILKLQDHFYSQGIHDTNQMIDAIHGVLKDAKPEVTRTEAMHLLGGYGDFKPLDKAPDAVGKRSQRVDAQLWSKIDALLNKHPMLKSGVERAELNAEQRAAHKKINKLMKELGIGALDPETQLKSTLEANKTRYRNSIEDMQRQIDRLEADEVARGSGPTDPELEQLRADYAKKKAEYEDIFGKPGISDAERLTKAAEHAEKSAIEAEAKVKVADTTVRALAEKQGPPTAETAAAQDRLRVAQTRRDAAQAELRFLRRTSEQNVIAGLEKRIEEVKSGIKKAMKTGATVETEKVAALRKELRDLQAERAKKPPRDPYDVAKQASMTRMANETARLQEKAMYKDFSPKTKRQQLARDAEWEKAAVELEQVKKNYEKQKKEEELANRTNAEKFRSLAKDVLFEPVRAIKTAWDLSAPGRQGIVFLLSHPYITATEHVPEMLRSFASEEAAARTDAAIRRRPLAKLGEMAKLDLTNHGDTLTHREEEIASRILRKIPGFKGSNRAYITFLNIQRATMFDMMVQGHPEAMTLAKAKAIAHAVNVGTGRGEAKSVAPAMGVAAHVLWAPKLLLSRAQLLTGEPMWRTDNAVRKQIAKEMYLRPLASVAALMGLGVMAGGKIEDGKLVFGNTRLDVLGGFMQLPVLLKRILTGEVRDSSGRMVKDRQGAWDNLTTFLRKKLAPIPAMGVDIVERKDVVGDPVTVTSLIKNTVTPLAWKDFYEASKDQGLPKGSLFGLMSIFGLGVQTYNARQRKEPVGSFWR